MMNKRQADVIYQLTSAVAWRAFEEVMRDDIQQIYLEMEHCAPERLPKLQGSVAQIKKYLNLRANAESVLSSDNTG